MTNRREFLQTTAIVAAVPIVARAGFADIARLDRLVVFDDRFSESRRFGARADRTGWSVRAISADVTSLWTQELSRRWSDRPLPLAGMTARPALFLLERLAWDHRMRVVYHVEHNPHIGGPNGEIAHSVRIPADGVGRGALEVAGEGWPEFMADSLTSTTVEEREAHGPSGASMPTRFGNDETVLHSWVIAPVASSARATEQRS